MLNYIIIGIFIILFFYSWVRPFSSPYIKWFLRMGSILACMNIIDQTLINIIAENIGIESGRLLLIYLSIITMFLFIFFIYERFAKMDRKISKLTSELAITNALLNKKNVINKD